MDKRWKVPKKKKIKIKRKPVELCRVLPMRLALIEGSIDWLVSPPKNKLSPRINEDLTKYMKELSEMIILKNSFATFDKL